MAFFSERLSLGKWWPQKTEHDPHDRLSKPAKGTIRSVKEVPDCLSHLTLDQLNDVMGECGKFNYPKDSKDA